jgi:hypothetical protein
MRSRRRAILSLFIPVLGACSELPTDSMTDSSPRYAGVGAPRFLEGNGSLPQIDGRMVASFRMAGLGPDASTLVTASADASGVWGCMVNDSEFDLFPAPLRVSERVSASSSFGQQNGQFSGALILPSPAVPFHCPPSHRLVPITTTFANVQLTHPDAPTFDIQGLFDVQNYFIRFEVAPTMTSVVLNETTLVLGGAHTTYSVTINNPGPERTNAGVQAWIRQGPIFRAADGIVVLCGSPSATLPTGDCTFSHVTSARNTAAGNGDLVAGPALFELHLKFSPSSRVMAGFAVPITLIN